jgi:LysR family hydrogen peroxide-inducible transcriptional activator
MSLAPLPFTLRQLQYLVAVADARSFRAAAQRCHVSQPSLSAQVAEAEGALGIRLFDRTQRGVLLTPAGADVVALARRLLGDAREVVETARRHLDPLSGTLRIGVIPTMAPYLLPEVVPVLRRAYPHLSVVWVEDKTENLVAALERGELDASLLALEAHLGTLQTETLGPDAFVVAVPRAHPLGRSSAPVSHEDLAGEPMLLLDEGHCMREQVLAYCATRQGQELGFRATSLPTLVQMVSGGAGITLLPEMAVALEAARASLRIRRFDRDAPSRTIALAFRRGSAFEPALRKLAASLRRHLARA